MIYALGAFDGFHRGHITLIERAREKASERTCQTGKKCGWGVITFDGHPKAVFAHDKFRLLCPGSERDMLVRALDINHVEKINFNREFASLSPDEFASYLESHFEIDGLVIGENFRFSKNRVGTPDVLEGLCRKYGWTLDVMPSLMLNNVVVSCTEIRNAVVSGNMGMAEEFFGYPYFLSGSVAHGDARGSEIGFPTANILISDDKIYPPCGVYAALLFLNDCWHTAALNIGDNPTFGGARAVRCEAHILDFCENIYGKKIYLFITSRVRGEVKFSSPDELVKQISNDIAFIKSTCADYCTRKKSVLEKFESAL